MASAFAHAAAALAISRLKLINKPAACLVFTGIVLSILPDIDSIGFNLGVPYNSFWGHRGFTHSVTFSFSISAVLPFIFSKVEPKARWRIMAFLFFCSISHALLDAMTTGGLGVAFFSPFNNTRYFFNFRSIKVSPLSVTEFFNGNGFAVLKSEAIWIGIPTVLIYIISLLVQQIRRK